MLDSRGQICENDNYTVPEQGEDTPENRKLREIALNRLRQKAKEEVERCSKLRKK